MENPIEKLLDEKTTAEERESLLSTLSPEQMVEYKTKAREAFEAELAKASAARKEKARVDALIAEKNQEIEKVNQTTSQFRSEQVAKAKDRLIAELKPSAEKLPEIEAMFSKLDSGKVDADLIYQDMKKAFVAVDPDSFLAAQNVAGAAAAAAAAATTAAAGSSSAAPSGMEPKKFSEQTTAFAQQIGATEEQAQRIMKDGGRRVLE